MRVSGVLIVGAGPTGLLLAAELARRDVPCVVADAHDAPLGWDRATIVHARSLEIFESLGLADRFLERGVPSHLVRFRSGGKTLGEMDLSSAHGRYGFDLGISEQVTEEILAGHLAACGGAVTRSTRLVGLRSAPDRVVATVENELGERHEVEADWLVGCDGFHSAVRDQAGIEFEGADIADPWAVFDAGLDGWDEPPDVQVAHLDVPPVILTPLPGNRYRVYTRPVSDDADLVADATAVVERYAPGAAFKEVENAVRFHCHSRVATRYRSGRILLAGDSAHACSPAEGHGMNTGIQDAFNLGWKLALVCRGEAEPALLDSYEIERRPVAERVVESGAAVESAQALRAAAERSERDETIRETFADPRSAHHEIVAGDAPGGIAPGDRLPDSLRAETTAGEPIELDALVGGPGHKVLVLGRPDAAPDVARAAAAVEGEIGGSPLLDRVAALTPDPEAADRLGIRGITLLAIRPDGYVGLRSEGGDSGTVRGYLAALTG